MKRFLALTALTLIITACAPQDNKTMSLAQRLENPLFAEHYAKMLVGRLTELEIDKDPILEDEEKRIMIENLKNTWMEADREARRIQREGMRAELVGVKEYALGEVLLLDHTLYFGPTFETDPGPGLSIVLSTVLDPRDVDFPDESSILIGPLESPYGAQRYVIDQTVDLSDIQTVTLWDSELGRIYGFGQLYQ